MLPSVIYLDSQNIISNGGTAIKLNNSGLISSESVSSPSAAESSTLNLSNYDQTTPNIILNGNFDDDLTSWFTTGTVTIEGGGIFPGIENLVVIGNISSLYQVVEGFENKNPVLSFQKTDSEIYVSLELLDEFDTLVGSRNRVFPANENFVQCNMGYYSGIPEATKCRVTFYSDNNYCKITQVKLQACYGFAGVTIGDILNDNRNSISFSAEKLFLGGADQLISTRQENLDIRGSGFFSGDVTILGNLITGPIYGPISSQSWATNILFSSGSATQVNWTSGLLQSVDTTTYGISSGNTGVLSSLVYIYIDLDISDSTLQVSSNYIDSIGSNKLLIASAQNGTTGYASFKVFSGQQNIINGSDGISLGSIVNGNLSINSVTASNIVASTITADKMNITTLSALTASMGALSVDNLLTMSGASSAITIGTTPPSSSTVGTGLYIDRNGVYSLNSNVQQATLTNLGLSAGGGKFLADVNGITLYSGSVISDPSTLKIIDTGSLSNTFSLYSYNNSGLTQQETHLIATSPLAGRSTLLDLFANGLTGTQGSIQLRATADSVTGSIFIAGGSPLSTCTITADTITNIGDIIVSNINIGDTLSSTPSGTIKIAEVSAPSAPSTNEGILYLDDNGAGKTRLMIRFSSGASQQIAIQP